MHELANACFSGAGVDQRIHQRKFLADGKRDRAAALGLSRCRFCGRDQTKGDDPYQNRHGRFSHIVLYKEESLCERKELCGAFLETAAATVSASCRWES